MCCSDCGYNIYTTEKEYLEDLRRQTKTTKHTKEIRELEAILSEKRQCGKNPIA